MDSNQDLGNTSNNFNNSGSLGDVLNERLNRQAIASQPASTAGLGDVLNQRLQQLEAPAEDSTPSAAPATVDDFVKQVAPAAQKVAQRLNVPVDAVIGQWGLETGWGKSVIPGTNNLGNIKSTNGDGVAATDNQTGSRDKYRQYPSVDHFAEDFSSLVGGGRYKNVAGSRDSTGYFSSLKSAGYAEDPAYVAKGVGAAKMAADALQRVGVGQQQQPQPNAAPDLSKAPAWADVMAKPDFKSLTPTEQAQAKSAYFDYWIAPNAGAQATALREQFLAQKAPQGPGFFEKAVGVAKDIGGAVVDAVTPTRSVLEGKAPQSPELPTDSKAPVRPEVRAAFNAQWDAATPEQRAEMGQREDWLGQLARERTGVFERQDARNLKSMPAVDPRIEARAQRLAAAGEDPRFAERAAREAAAAGVMPGREIEFLQRNGGVAQKSEFDFDTKQLFDTKGDRNGLNNPLVRGAAKGVMGMGKAVTGYGEFLADTMGLDNASKTMREGGNWARGKEEAIGESGTFMERNFEGAINSIAQQLPLLVTGAKLESEAIPLAGIAMQSFGQEYSDGRAKGQTIGEATTRAAIFAAFEVIGEKFGLHDTMQAIKGAARGMPNDQIAGFLWSALKKEVPGELLTTTGQFGTDKLPGGIGLNPNATGEDYLKQVADTVAQTIMQSGLMVGGTTGVSKAVRFARDRGPTTAVAEADAELAKAQALNKWNNSGLVTNQTSTPSTDVRIEPTFSDQPVTQPAVTPDGRIEQAPAEPVAPQQHQTSKDADAIVTELAQQAGIPLETVLPQSAPEQSAPQSAISDQDVTNFAASRYQQLRDKRDGTVDEDTGEVVPGPGLSPTEQQEMATLEQSRGNTQALRQQYGFDQQHEAAPAEQSLTPHETAKNALREIARRSSVALPNHPSMPVEATNDGTFAGSGLLNVDQDGNVVLQRVAGNIEDLTKKGNSKASLKELIDQSMFHGGGLQSDAISTSGNTEFTSGYGISRFGSDRTVGTFKIPIQDLLSMIDRGEATIGNIGEGEILLSGSSAAPYLTNVQNSNSAATQTSTTSTPVQAPVEQPATVPLSERTDEDLRQQLRDAGDRGIQNQISEELQRRKAEQEPVQEQPTEQVAEAAPNQEDATAQDTAQQPAQAEAAPATAPAHKTEKERNQRADYSDKWFGSLEKAQGFINRKRIGATHQAVKEGKQYLIKPKETNNEPQAAQAEQAQAQRQEEPAAEAVTTPAQTESTTTDSEREAWWNSLTAVGRRRVITSAGIRSLPERVYWHNVADGVKDMLWAKKQSAEEEPAAAAVAQQQQPITSTQPTQGVSNGNQSTEQTSSTEQSTGQVAQQGRQEGLLNEPDAATWQSMTPEQRRRSTLEREIATGMANNGGVMGKIRPAAIELRKKELAAMGDAGKIDAQQQPAQVAENATEGAGVSQPTPATAAPSVEENSTPTQQQAGVSPESVVSEQDLAAFNESIKAVRDESFGEPKREQSASTPKTEREAKAKKDEALMTQFRERLGALSSRAHQADDSKLGARIGSDLVGLKPGAINFNQQWLDEAVARYEPQVAKSEKKFAASQGTAPRTEPEAKAMRAAKAAPGREGYDTPVQVDAKRLMTILESTRGESIVDKPAKLEAWRNGTSKTDPVKSPIEIGFNSSGKLDVNDGRHRIALAAERGEKVTAFIAGSDVARLDVLLKPAQNEQTATEKQNASPVQTSSIPEGSSRQTVEDATAGNRDSESVAPGVAASSEGTAGVGTVPASTDQPGATGARGTEQSGQQPSGPARDSAGVRTEPVPTGSNEQFVIDGEDIGKGGLTKKYRDNIAAIKILKALDAEGRVATPEERKSLAKYVGWGALKGPFDPENKQWSKQHAELKELLTEAEFKAARRSTLDAHYTSPIAVGAMYDAMGRLGFTGGRVLEPSVGSGNFFGLMPRELRNASQLHGVELDALTSKLVSALYPEAKIAKNTGFEDFEIPSEFFDAVIGNPPFGNQPLVDKERSAYSGFSIHNYFLAKGIDKLRPGGVMAVVVSHNFLDANDGRARKWIGERASLIGAVRLPNTAFKENAGTEVVTDILVFQKHDKNGIGRSDAGEWQNVVDQKNINPKTGEAITHKVNEFFANRPGDVLGTPTAAGSMYSANEYTIEPTGDLKQQLAGWVKALPSNVFTPIDRTSDNNVTDMAVPDGVKVGSYYIDDGRIMQRGEDVMGDKTATVWTPPNEKAALRMRGMIALRDTLRQQMRLERSADATTDEIEKNRTLLNRQYDEFLKKYGHINNPTNRRIFLDDTESQLIQALEFDYDKGISKEVAEREEIEPRDASAVKADIFNRRVAFPPQDFLTVESAKDALLASLNYRGKIDTSYMEEVFHKPAAEIVKELGDVVFNDPQHGIVTADEYLSGDVKTKLAEAQSAAKDNPYYKRNVAALEKVIPADKKPSEISASIGASFVPAEMYQQFVKHISGGDATVFQINATGQWMVDYKGQADTALNTGKFGTKDLNAQELFKLSMLGRGAVVKKIIKNPDGSTTTLLLEKETEAAREKQNAIKAEWQKWLWQDPERSDKIASIYNEKMNRIVDRKYDGSHMTFPGMNPAINMLAHQKNGVWRGLQSRQVLYDHVVGAGKTFQMAALAMEMRRLGIARKPLFVVPNHLTLQWRSEFTRLYPGANILAATPEDFGKGNRERMFSKIITGDWDSVVIGHSSLKKIGLPTETEKAVLQEQIDEIAEAVEEMKRGRGDRNIIREMEKIRSNLEAKMKDKLAAIGARDKVVSFDELGIDAMFVDEMHEFKNLTYNSTMDRNPGMGNPAGSAKAFDMFVKTRWLFDTFGSKVPYVTATGTPVSNSLVEMFNMQRYMQYPTIKAQGLNVFDSWAKQFGSVDNVYEVAPSGSGYRQSTRFAKFTNLPALMGLYNSFADTVTLDDLKAQEEAQGKRFPVPRVMGGKPTIVVAKRSPLVTEFMGVPRAEVGEDGQVKFGLDLSEPISITQDKQTGKWVAKSGQDVVGTFDTEQDAKIKIVEQSLSPMVSVDNESILGRFANLRQLNKETKGKVNALSLTGEANKAGLDYRLIDPSAPDFAGSKINMAVDHIVRLHKQWDADKGTQLVFCDMSIPTSARSSYATKARRLYVLDDAGAVTMKRGTMHTVAGHEYLPFFVVQRGQKDAKRFDVFDAASGIKVKSDLLTKADAIEAASGFITDDKKRQRWIDSARAREITQDQIDAYNDEHEVETEGIESFTREDIAGISGSSKFSVYDDIKAKLVAKGIPEREVAFIHDYSTPAAKDKLFKAVNAGDVRVLLGSTPKMGAGTNVQKRLVGLHHIDAPWRPSDLEQREGRIIRRGNDLYARDPEGFEIFIGRYATEQTYDTRRWQILEHKARGIEQLRNYDGSLNEIDDIEGEAANSADMKAAASGDPMILQETSLRNEVRRLEQLQAAHADGVLSLTRKARSERDYAEKYGPRLVDDVKGLIATVKKNPLDAEGWAPVTVNGKVLAVKEKALEEIARVASVVRAGMEEEARVKYRGLEFVLHRPHGPLLYAETPTGTLATWSTSDQFSTSGFVQRLKNYVDRLPAILEDTKARVEKAANDAKALLEESRQPFAQAADLERARDDHKKVQRALMAKGPVVPDEQKALVAAGIAEQKAKLEKLGYGDALREFFGAQETPMFTRASTPAKAMPSAQVSSIVDAISSEWKNAPQIVVADNMDDTRIPQAVRDYDQRQKSLGATGEPEGFFYGGKVYVMASQMGSSTDVMRVVFHEALGHVGLRGAFGKSLDQVLQQIIDARPALVEAKASAYGLDMSKPADQLTAAEEVLAEMAQTRPEIGVVRRAIAAVRTWLREHGFDLKLSDDEIVRNFIAPARGFVERGVGVADEQQRIEPAFSRSNITRRIQNNVLQFWGNQDGRNSRTFGAYDKSLSTQFNKALKDKHYGKVFGLVNAMQNEVALTSARPAELAPGVLPRVDDVKSAAKQLVLGKKQNSQLAKSAEAIFAGTLDGGGRHVMNGKVWSESELRSNFGLDDAGVALYQQTRAAIDASLNEVAAAEAWDMGQTLLPKAMRRQVIDNPAGAEAMITGEIRKQMNMLDVAIKAAKKLGNQEQASELLAARNGYAETLGKIEKIFATSQNLQKAGYAPLMRFGKYTVTVQAVDPMTGAVARDEDGESITEFYGQYETQGEANAVFAKMQERYGNDPGYRVTDGIKSQKGNELYAGISPETIALFAEAVGADKAMKKYIELAMTERSALKRRLDRKGTEGYSEDLPRVLANFITSNGRFAAQRYYLRDLNNAIKYIPKEKGDVFDEAMALKKFVMDPQDTGAAASAIMFSWFLGGSVASALVNLTQPVLMTAPYLSQFGVKAATTELAKAIPYAVGKKQITDADLLDALKRTGQEGIVDAQEIFHLYSVGAQSVASGLVNTLSKLPGVGDKIKAGSESARARATAFGTLWGSMFSLAEGFNRKLTFIAAWEIAKARGEKNPYAFAVRAVNETQGIYNKVNRPNWARSTPGRVILTFKQYSIMYLEMFSRMAKHGGPAGKRAALMMLAVLMLAAGEEGIPFSQDVDDLIDTIGQLFGQDTNMKRWKRRRAHEILGKEFGDLLLYGVSSFLPLDFSGRLGLGNLIPGTGMLKPSSAANRTREVSEVFGPAAGMLTQIADAYDAAAEGNWGKAAQNLLPKAVKDVAAGLEMARKGYGTDTKGRKVTEVTKGEAALKGIGFNPTTMAQESRKTAPVYQDIALQKRTEASIVDQWAQALADKDQAGVEKQIKRWQDWNRDNPDTQIKISADQIRSKVRQLNTDKDTRILKQAPREMRGAIGLDMAK